MRKLPSWQPEKATKFHKYLSKIRNLVFLKLKHLLIKTFKHAPLRRKESGTCGNLDRFKNWEKTRPSSSFLQYNNSYNGRRAHFFTFKTMFTIKLTMVVCRRPSDLAIQLLMEILCTTGLFQKYMDQAPAIIQLSNS